jgi:hypothetical protein
VGGRLPAAHVDLEHDRDDATALSTRAVGDAPPEVVETGSHGDVVRHGSYEIGTLRKDDRATSPPPAAFVLIEDTLIRRLILALRQEPPPE